MYGWNITISGNKSKLKKKKSKRRTKYDEWIVLPNESYKWDFIL